MKKDITRDYAIEMFRAFAAEGMPTPSKVKATAKASKDIAYWVDVLAASESIDLLEREHKEMIAKAVKEIYCANATERAKKGEIEARVRRFADRNYIDDRTVYRWLRKARTLCASLRGLRTSVDGDVRKVVSS